MQVITLVGRAPTVESYVSESIKYLYGGFKIIAAHSLGEPGIDHLERFLILISADGDTEFDFETQVDRLNNSTEFRARSFSSMDEALEYSKEEYDLSEEKARMHLEYEELVEKFPQISAEESEQYSVMDAFVKLGRVSAVPAQLYGERAIAIVSVSHGPDEMRITPLAILATEEIVENLELPGEE